MPRFVSFKCQTPQVWSKRTLSLSRNQKIATSLSIKMLSRLCASTTLSLPSLSQPSQLFGQISAARKHVYMIPLSSCCRVGSSSKLYNMRSGWRGDKALKGRIRLERLRSSGTGWGGSAQLEPLDLTEENVEQVLLDARSEVCISSFWLDFPFFCLCGCFFSLFFTSCIVHTNASSLNSSILGYTRLFN